jgi:hypothetical protein
MIKTMEAFGDRLLARFVPNITAKAEPCECSGVWSREIQCYCWCYISVRRTQSCYGCHYTYGACHDTWNFCMQGCY